MKLMLVIVLETLVVGIVKIRMVCNVHWLKQIDYKIAQIALELLLKNIITN